MWWRFALAGISIILLWENLWILLILGSSYVLFKLEIFNYIPDGMTLEIRLKRIIDLVKPEMLKLYQKVKSNW